MACCSNRRTFLKALTGAAALAAAGSPVLRALAAPPGGEHEYFIFIDIAGGWDVLLWSDPRNERRGLVDPPSTENLRTEGLRRWVDRPLEAGASTFEPVRPPGSNLVFGPAIGALAELHDRLTLVNGIAMNTVSHPDGTVFSATGQHLVGSRAVSPSIDTILANELGLGALFPLVSARFPSWFVGENLDRRATPVLVDSIGAIGKSLTRSTRYDRAEERGAISELLVQEARDLAEVAYYPEVYEGLSLQYESLQRILANDLRDVFTASELRRAQPGFDYGGRFHGAEAVSAAFAVEALKRDVVRCASFGLQGFDTHTGNYQNHALMLQEAFDLIAALVQALDVSPHPTLDGERLSDHTHILVISEFCRGPMMNSAGGRDHYPNNSALILSPRFRGGFLVGKSDEEQLLPVTTRAFSDGERPISPADVLATFLGAFGIEPSKYLRDGESMPELLAT
ncbi:hypothetical protein SOCE26_048310 [Sorangium cellulosum]|uniref:DUF1501 domain-containing protein n=1 Tax=Sorangium cellulosum TaxID=56 RepID=A0A2L0EVQ4_SORCE|nr:DUF1501 domain-containing protein [Sorangium cellulosum]AUX43383.1 hypothetical protein SOCE26_048310 [Sorangium cellulosum]